MEHLGRIACRGKSAQPFPSKDSCEAAIRCCRDQQTVSNMHDTAFHIGTLAMNIYADLRSAAILEVGSLAVNGSLRDNALPTTNYVGVDLEVGEGVDVVVEPGKPLPLPDETFDLVMASSVFEHDPCFWMTFLEMCRTAKNGGYVYVSAPSNGIVHRYPQDNWRFYPDSGKALVQWATSQGQHVTLVESFIADRENDMWNDFVAVFRKGRITKTLPKVFLHEHVPCSNVTTWRSKRIINPRDEPEDMVLLREAVQQAERVGEQLAETTQEREALAEATAQLTAKLAEADEQSRQNLVERDTLQERLAEAENARGELLLRESELRQRQEEIEQTRSDAAKLRAELQSLMEKLAESERVRDQLRLRESELRQRQEEIEQTRSDAAKLRAELEEVRARLAASEHQVQLEEVRRHQLESIVDEWKDLQDRAHAAKVALEARLNERFEEIATLTRELQEAQAAGANVRDKLARTETEFAAAIEQSREEKQRLELRLKDRFQEIATLSSMLAEREAQARRSREEADWFHQAGFVLANDSGTAKGRLLGLLPAFIQHKRQRRVLKQKGLFDGDAYLAAHPDVAAAGHDPLSHYLRHGIKENRYRG